MHRQSCKKEGENRHPRSRLLSFLSRIVGPNNTQISFGGRSLHLIAYNTSKVTDVVLSGAQKPSAPILEFVDGELESAVVDGRSMYARLIISMNWKEYVFSPDPMAVLSIILPMPSMLT